MSVGVAWKMMEGHFPWKETLDPAAVYVLHAPVSDACRHASALEADGRGVWATVGMRVRPNRARVASGGVWWKWPWSERDLTGTIVSLDGDRETEMSVLWDGHSEPRHGFKGGKRSEFDLVSA